MNLMLIFSPLSPWFNFQSNSFAEDKPVIVASSSYEASVMRSVARAPALVQPECIEKLVGVKGTAWFRV